MVKAVGWHCVRGLLERRTAVALRNEVLPLQLGPMMTLSVSAVEFVDTGWRMVLLLGLAFLRHELGWCNWWQGHGEGVDLSSPMISGVMSMVRSGRLDAACDELFFDWLRDGSRRCVASCACDWCVFGGWKVRPARERVAAKQLCASDPVWRW